MRDLLSLLENIEKTAILEATLAASEIPSNKASAVTNPKTGKPYSRPELFLSKVLAKSPFTLKDGGEEVVIDPTEANKVSAWLKTGPKGVITLNTTVPGQTVKNTELLKTVEFGSKEAETIKLKGSDIFATSDQDVQDFGNNIESILRAGGFPAIDMYDKIANSEAMQSLGKVGDAVIYMAKQITQGQVPEFPTNLSDNEIKAIELYASEYLGVLGLISGTVPFKRGTRKEFDDFIGTDLETMIMYFPKSVSNPLADSFSVVNDETGHAVKISSKAAGKGAPPSLSSLKLPDEIKAKYPEVADFLNAANNTAYSAFTQPFYLMNWLYNNNPKLVPNSYKSILPFQPNFIEALEKAHKINKPVPQDTMKAFAPRISDKVKSGDSTDAGKIWYAVTKDVMKAVNDDNAVPGFQAAIIKSLGHNFIQLYTNKKGNKLVTDAFWPATISGNVRLKTKGSSKEPTKGKISVEISPGKDSDMGAETSSSAPIPDQEPIDQLAAEPKRASIKAATKKLAPSKDDAVLGRKRRK